MDEVFKLFGTIALNMGDFNGQLDDATSEAESTADKISSSFQAMGERVGSAAIDAADHIDKIDTAEAGIGDKPVGEGMFNPIDEGADAAISGIDKVKESADTMGASFKEGSSEAKAGLDSVGTGAAEAGDKVEESGEKAKGFGSGLMSTFGSMALITGLVALGEKVKEMVPEMVSGNDAMTKWKNAMEAMGNSKGSVDEMAESIEDFSKKTGVSEESVEGLSQKLAGAGVPAFMNVTKSVLSMGAALGASPDKMTRATRALQNVAQTGKLTSSTFTTLNQAIPGSAEMLQKAMGEGGKSATQFAADLKSGKVTTDDFYKALQTVGMSKDIQGLANQPRTMGGALQKMKTDAIDAGEGILNSFGGSGGAVGAINIFSSALAGGAKALSGLITFLQPVGAAIMSFVEWLEKGGTGVKVLAGAIISLTTAFAAYNVATKAVALYTKLAAAAQMLLNGTMEVNPIVAVATAIAALVAGLVFFFTQTKTGQKVWADFTKGFEKTGVIQAFGSVIKAAQGVVGSFVSAVGKIASTFASAVGATTKGSNAFKLFGTQVGNILKVVANVVTSVLGTIGKLFQNIATIISGVINVVSGLLTGKWSKAWKGVQQIVRGAMNAVKNYIGGVLNAVLALFGTNLTKVSSTVSSIFNKIGSTISSIMSSISTTISNVWKIITTTVQTVVNTIDKDISTAWNLIYKTISSILNIISSTIKNIWNNIVNLINTSLHAIVTAVSKQFTDAVNSIKSIFGAISGWFSNIWNSVKNVFSGVSSFFSNVFSGAYNAITGALSGVSKWFSGMVSGIKGAFNGIGSFFSGVGSDIWNGIKSGLKGVLGAVPIVGKQIIKALGLATGGYVQGAGTETSDSIPAMLSNGEYVLNAEAVKRLGKQNLDYLNNNQSAKMNSKVMKNRAGSVDTMASGSGITINLTQYITSQKVLSPKDVANQTKKALQDLTRKYKHGGTI